MDQETYRQVNHYREAILREDGSPVTVDDVTFDPAIHEEIAAEKAIHEEIAAKKAEKPEA